jgi:hypothetical protein
MYFVARERVAIVAPPTRGVKGKEMIASILSTLGSLTKLPELFLSFLRWKQQNKLKLIISRIEFRPKAGLGAGLMIELTNRTERPVKVSADVVLQTGEVMVSFGLWEVIPSEDKRQLEVSLVAGRKNYLIRPQIVKIKLYDSADRFLFVSKKTVDRLNDQILNEWPFSEDEELEN